MQYARPTATVAILFLIWAVQTILGIIVAQTIYNALSKQNAEMFGRAIVRCNALDAAQVYFVNLVVRQY